MADDVCLSCIWAEIQPSLFGGAADERCGHAKALDQRYDAFEEPLPARQTKLVTMRHHDWLCGPDAALWEAKPNG